MYDANGRAIFSVDPHEDSTPDDTFLPAPGTKTIYDSLGRVIETQRLASLTIKLQPDDAHAGLKVAPEPLPADVGPVLSFDETIYDAAGRVDYTRQIGAGQTLISKSIYDAAGQTLQSIQDLDGNLLTAGDQLVTTYEYDQAGRQTRVTDALGRQTRYEYDKLGRQVAVILPNVIDRATGAVLHDHLRTETVYDALGRRSRTIENITQETPGNASTIDYSQARTTDYEYDDSGRLTAVVLPEVLDAETALPVRPRYEYEYDLYGNQKIIRDPKGRETTFTYDELNRQKTRELPDGLTESKFYDDFDQLELSVDFEGRYTAYLYDTLGRLATKEFFVDATAYNAGQGTPSKTVEYTYDALARQIEVVQDDNPGSAGGESATNYAYDTFGRVMQIASPEGVINYGYDNLGRKTRTWTSHGTTGSELSDAITDTQYTYDVLGRLKTVDVVERNNVPVTENATEYRYDTNGNLSQVELPNGVIQDYLYDELNRLVRLRHFNDANANDLFDVGEAVLAEFEYTLRDDGKRSRAVETNDLGNTTTIDWIYDNLGRLTEERYNAEGTDYDFIARYSFDLASNRAAIEKDAGNADPGNFTADETTTYVYDANDRLKREEFDVQGTMVGDTTTFYQYGADGNRTEQTKQTVYNGGYTSDPGIGATKTTTYEYNVQGQLSQVTIVEGSTTTVTGYKYNDGGARVEQTVSVNGAAATVTQYHIDPQNASGYAKAIEEVVDGTLARSYAIGHAIISQASAAGVVAYLLHDGHGSTRALVDAAGLVVERYAYDAYGSTLSRAGLTSADSAQTTWLFANDGQYDPASALTNHIARWRQGPRFLTLDPFAGDTQDPLSLHKYAYTHANAVMGVDPSGLSEFSVAGLSASIGIGATISVGDAYLRGERGWELADDAVIGGVFGAGGYAIFAANAAYRAVRLIQTTTLLVGTGFGVYGTASAISEGNYGLAAYRGVFTVLGGVAFKAKLDTIRLPQGFRSVADYNKFVDATANALKNIGADDASVAIRGSSVTGRSYHTGKGFGEASDIDLAVASESLLARCQQLGFELRGGGSRTRPLTRSELAKLGLSDIAEALSSQLNRDVSFMIYRSAEVIIERGNAWFVE